MKVLLLLSLFLVGCSNDERIMEMDRQENQRLTEQMQYEKFHSGFEDSAQAKSRKDDDSKTEEGIRSLRQLLRHLQHKGI